MTIDVTCPCCNNEFPTLVEQQDYEPDTGLNEALVFDDPLKCPHCGYFFTNPDLERISLGHFDNRP